MGYYVTVRESNVVIPAEKLDEAYKALVALNDDNTIKTGGNGNRFKDGWLEANPTGANENVWFAWMQWNYPEIYKTAADILEAVGFELWPQEDGSLAIGLYDNKAGCESTFLAALAPFAVSSDDRLPQVIWQGEAGEIWRQVFVNGECKLQDAHIAFDEVE